MRYKEIKYQIETLIASMRPDEPLPSRDALCHMLMTTRATLHKAIQELVQENKLYTRGGKVSDDIGVISIDNFEKECLLMKPQLSSIGGHPFEIGRKAAQILLDEMNHKPGKALLFFYLPVLFDRDSCRGPKPSNT